MNEKYILDACCGGRQFWWDKNHEGVIYMDIRQLKKGSISLQPNFEIEPDIIGDYRSMSKEWDSKFKLVVWDIPHKLKADKGLITAKYGYLGDKWRDDVKRGFNEIMRVLEPHGMLVFKYADLQITVADMLSSFPIEPLFGTRSKKGVNSTYWFIFMKEVKP